MGRSGQSRGRQTARISHVESALDDHNKETAKKMALVLKEFHLKYVTPLEQRVAWLETPWYRRLFLRTRGWAVRVVARFRNWISGR